MSDSLDTAQAPTQEVIDLAQACGVATEYWDQQGNHKVISAATLEHVLRALNIDISTAESRAAAWDRINNDAWRSMVPSVVVLRSGRAQDVQVHVVDGAPVTVSLEFEDGGSINLQQIDRWVPPREIDGVMTGEATFLLPDNLPLGWHTLTAISDDGSNPARSASGMVVVTPDYLELPETMKNKRTWGLMAQLYATRSAESWGLGDLHDLGSLSAWGGEQGADFVLVNPMHAAEVSPPMAPSPYLPATRRYFNPIFLHIEDIAEYATADTAVQAKISAMGAELKTLNATTELLDRDRVWAAKKQALEMLLTPALSASRQAAFDEYAAKEGDGLTLFATWCAFAEKWGISYGTWPEGIRRADGPDMARYTAEFADRIDFYAKLQWLLDEQFAAAQAAAHAAGMSAGIVHDLAVGVHPEGADAWALRDVLAQGVSVGAPPDAFNQMGQDWSQPPWRPDALVAAAYVPYRDMLRTILRHSGGIRVDHVLGLFRLWWIPNGMGAAAGTFVKYDHEALVGILALEAHRAGAFVVGEDLGTVQPWIQDYLGSRGIIGTSILWFESNDHGSAREPELWRSLCFGTVTVHDIPPTAGFIDGEHIRMRQDLGLLTRPIEDEWQDHEKLLNGWRNLLVSRGYVKSSAAELTSQEFVEGLHRVLYNTPCALLAVAVPDLVGDTRAQNQPGTDQEYPNWRVPTATADGQALLIEDLKSSPELLERAQRLIAALTRGA